MATITIEPLSRSALATLYQLFLNGPTWDGNIVSKTGRQELIVRGYAFRVEGYASLTHEGVRLAATSGLDRKKEIARRAAKR